jgi:hypothetical protein
MLLGLLLNVCFFFFFGGGGREVGVVGGEGCFWFEKCDDVT